MKRLYFIPLIIYLSFSVLSCMNPPEGIPEDTEEELVEDEEGGIEEDGEEEPGEDAILILNLVEVSESILGIDLTNDVPVRGVQFTLEGPEITDVLTTSRTEGFFAQFNKENGKVIMLSLVGDSINPGMGPIAEIVCDHTDSAASLSGVKIVE